MEIKKINKIGATSWLEYVEKTMDSFGSCYDCKMIGPTCASTIVDVLKPAENKGSVEYVFSDDYWSSEINVKKEVEKTSGNFGFSEKFKVTIRWKTGSDHVVLFVFLVNKKTDKIEFIVSIGDDDSQNFYNTIKKNVESL